MTTSAVVVPRNGGAAAQVWCRSRLRGERLAQPPRPPRRRSVGRRPACRSARARQQPVSIRSSTVTGLGTSPSSVRNATDASQSAGSMAPRPLVLLDRPAPHLDGRVEDRGLRVAGRPRAPAPRRSRRRGPPRASRRSPASPGGSRRRTPAIASCLVSRVAVPTISPLPGRGVISSTRRTLTSSPVSRAGPARCWRTRSRHRPHPG